MGGEGLHAGQYLPAVVLRYAGALARADVQHPLRHRHTRPTTAQRTGARRARRDARMWCCCRKLPARRQAEQIAETAGRRTWRMVGRDGPRRANSATRFSVVGRCETSRIGRCRDGAGHWSRVRCWPRASMLTASGYAQSPRTSGCGRADRSNDRDRPGDGRGGVRTCRAGRRLKRPASSAPCHRRLRQHLTDCATAGGRLPQPSFPSPRPVAAPRTISTCATCGCARCPCCRARPQTIGRCWSRSRCIVERSWRPPTTS